MYRTAFLDLPPLHTAAGSVALPGSKSISNRVLLLAALSSGTTIVHDLLASDDTHVMLQALRALGCGVQEAGPDCVHITGLGGRQPAAASAAGTAEATAGDAAIALFLGNAGTAMRPLTAALALLGGEYSLSGIARMHERPIGDLVDALRQLGCQINYLGTPGYPPLRIAHGAGLPALQLDAPIRVRGDVSSQFLTALLMALPLAAHTQDITIEVVGELTSKPYIHITLQLLARFGITVQQDGWQRFTIAAGSRYQSPGSIHVEADASSASYFIALGAIAASPEGQNDQQKITPNGITIEGVGLDSIQGDIRFVDAVRAMGAHIEGGANWLRITRGAWPLKAIDLDCNHIPDAAMTLVTMALYADGPCTLRNIASWRVKETDRIAAMANEARKLGAQVEEGSDWIRIHPLPHAQDWRAASIHTYDDHRVAMCFSLAAFNPARLPVRIQDPQCVGKTFPDYFEALFSVVQTPLEAIPVLCIDGPTASGKGTVAARLAEQLGYAYLDSGALYRLTALAALRVGIAQADSPPASLAQSEAALADVAARLSVRFAQGRIWLDEQDATDAIRAEAVGMLASRISALPAVRATLVGLQHRFARLPGLVADGRDMGTVIFPHAPLKIFLTASAACRAQRRYDQLQAKGISANIDSLRADLEARDAQDQNRASAPLKPAQDAVLLDSSTLSAEATIEQVLAWWQQRQPFAS